MQTSSDHQPLTWVKRVPVYAITIYVALNVLGMFATAIGMAAGASPMALAFSPERFLQGQFWLLLTAPFINVPSFFFPFNMLFLYWAGVEVEKYLGRTQFLKLLGLMLLVPPVVLMVWTGAGARGLLTFGSGEISIGMIIAFATLYPGVEFFGWVTMKWVALAVAVLSALQALASRDWPNFTVVLAMSGVAFGSIRLIQYGGFSALPKWPAPKQKPGARAPRKIIPMVPEADEDDVVASIDPLLEKIARSGLQSLTQKERAQLERARQSLLNKH